MRRKLLMLLIILPILATTLSCSPVYVMRAGVEEAKILSRRRPIVDVARDPGTTEEVRRKLALVLEARNFAARRLDLNVGESYTTYSWIDRDTLALVVSAAHRDRFEAHTWWFPIVGSVPYKGYFSLAAAEREARKLEAKGLDTYIRTTSAFSTLGWFNDPLLSTLMRYDDVSLAATVIHEVTHNTLYLPSQVAFNESFATFVGDRGAIEYFCLLEGEAGDRCRKARADWADNLVFGRFLERLVSGMEAVYRRTDLTAEERIAGRDLVLEEERRRFLTESAPSLHNLGYRVMVAEELNNAQLIAWRLYYDRLHLFDAAWDRHGRDVRRTVAAIREATAGGGDPWQALEGLAGR